MSKRRAGTELTRDNWDDEEEKVETGVFKVADDGVLKNRVMKKAKRTIQRNESSEIKPIFSGFSGFNKISSNSNSKQAFSFLTKCSEIPSESGNHPSASTINSMSTSSSLKFSDNNYSKSSAPSIINPVKVMKLNEAFVKFVTNAVQQNPYCVLTPTLKDYEKQVSKFVNLSGCKTNTSDSSMASTKDHPQVSSFENTIKRLKNSDEVKNNSVNVQKTPTTFTNPTSNTSNNGLVFNFGNKSPVFTVNESKKGDLKLDNKDVKPKEESLEPKLKTTSTEEPKSQTTSLEEPKLETTTVEEPKKTPTTGEFKLSDFKFNKVNEQSLSSPFNNKPSDFVFGDKKTSPLNKPSEMKFNIPSFNFGTTSTFSFKPMEQQNDQKPFFSFGSKPSNTNAVADTSKNTEVQKPKDEEEDEDQPPVVNFTPVKESDAIFESKSKLYHFKDGKYEEHGVGQLYLKSVDDKKIQLIMRNDSALGTIMVNTLLNESVNFTKRNAKNVQLICVLDATKSTKPQTVLFKFKDSQITDSFENELLKLKK